MDTATNGTGPSVGVWYDYSVEERPDEAAIIASRYIAGAPFPVTHCRPGAVVECDIVVSFSVLRFSDEEMTQLEQHPRHTRMEVGWWPPPGAPRSEWCARLARAALRTYYLSPAHRDRLRAQHGLNGDGDFDALPPPLALPLSAYGELRAMGRVADERPEGSVWTGLWSPDEGSDLLMRWAQRHDDKIHAYGIGVPRGEIAPNLEGQGWIPPEQMLTTLQRYRTCLRFPRVPMPFDYTTIDAYLLGLEVTHLGGAIGCLSYEQPLDRVALQAEQSAARLWMEAAA